MTATRQDSAGLHLGELEGCPWKCKGGEVSMAEMRQRDGQKMGATSLKPDVVPPETPYPAPRSGPSG